MVPAGAVGVPVSAGDILLGKYRVERVLGRGGMGVVVAARHIDLDELFAIKLMLLGAGADGESIERFLREARAAAKIKSEHVARTQDVGRLPDGTPYMVMEHLTGCDLKTVLRDRGPLPVGECVTYGVQAAETLGEAHELGIIHRDVKPANMFLTRRRNGSPCIKVLDFGISKHTSEDAVGLTQTATIGGSPLYMSPEQMRSAKHVDARADIWSLGVVLYELLIGVTPFHAPTITAVTSRVLQDEPVPPSRLRPEIPPALDAAIMRCLQKRPDDRFRSMAELSAALRGALAPGASPPPTPYEPPPLSVGRTSFGLAAHATGGSSARTALPPSVASTGAEGNTSRGLTSTSLVAPRTALSGRIALLVAGGALAIGIVIGAALLTRGPGQGQDESGATSRSFTASLGDTAAPSIPVVPAGDTVPPVAAVPSGEPTVEPREPAPAPSSTVAPAPASTGAPAPASAGATAAPVNKPVADKPSPRPPAPKPTATAPGRKHRTID